MSITLRPTRLRNDWGGDYGFGVGGTGSDGGWSYHNSDWMGNPTYSDPKSNLGNQGNVTKPGTGAGGLGIPTGTGAGTTAGTVASAIGTYGPLIGSVISAIGQALSTQYRQSYGNRAPAGIDANDQRLRDVYARLTGQMDKGIDLPTAPTSGFPTFTGGGLPMPIGLLAAGGGGSSVLGGPGPGPFGGGPGGGGNPGPGPSPSPSPSPGPGGGGRQNTGGLPRTIDPLAPDPNTIPPDLSGEPYAWGVRRRTTPAPGATNDPQQLLSALQILGSQYR